MVATIPCLSWEVLDRSQMEWWIEVARRTGVHSIGNWQGKDKGPARHVRVPIGSIGGFTFGELRCHL